MREHLLHGVVLLDKPKGPTSRKAALSAGQLLGIRKVGHGGTLDPKVTGVLPVLLGASTPLAEILLGCDKVYEGTLALHGDVAQLDLERAMASFVGLIEQMPPVRSAVKRALRKRTVYSFELTALKGREAMFMCSCEGGTYIRKLVHDLGTSLGCGAHMTSLRRMQAGPFDIGECVTIDGLAAAVALPRSERDAELRRMVLAAEDVVKRVRPGLWVADGAVRSVCTGYPLTAAGVCRLQHFAIGQGVVLFTLKDELLALGSAMMSSADIIRKRRGLCVQQDRVFIDPHVYPKWGGSNG